VILSRAAIDALTREEAAILLNFEFLSICLPNIMAQFVDFTLAPISRRQCSEWCAQNFGDLSLKL
jgi:hypothetical protein